MLLRSFFLKALFLKTKDEKRETNGRQKESSDFFRWFGSFLLLLQNNPKLWGRRVKCLFEVLHKNIPPAPFKGGDVTVCIVKGGI